MTDRAGHGWRVRLLWAVCLLLAGMNHARILIAHGLLWDYGGVGQASAVYWSSLTLADPLVAGVLLRHPRFGVPLTAVLIATNVAHNVAVTVRFAPGGPSLPRVAATLPLLAQIAFLLFVVATYRIAARR